MNREIYNKIREFSVDMYTQGFSDGYTDGSTRGCEVEKAHEYKKGFQKGYSQGRQETYEKGLKDAWEAARKITNDLPIPELESRELSVDDCEDEYEYSCKVIKMYSASEVIDKLKGHTSKPNYPVRDCKTCKNSRDGGIALTATCCDCMSDSQYEPIQSEDKCADDEIRVGDEVIMYANCNYKGVVISIPYGKRFNVLSEDSGVWIIDDKDDITKTGRHFPLITEMLNQLKEEIKE